MEPSSDVARSMTRIDGFRQNTPRDGDPVSQRTEAYVGYDETNVYVVFVCFDSEPDKIRATLSRREDILGDDKVEIFLDTFNDQRRSYVFTVNPLGVQTDGTWVEQEGSQYDRSFDTVWDSRGTLTEEGYVAWIAVPFKSLRFSPEKSQEWGLILARRVFDNRIVRGKLSWQPTLRLSLRSIVQYNTLLTDPQLTSLETSKNLNVDLLATYLVNPWTALYIGYNNNQNDLRLVPTGDGSELIRTDQIGPDSWQFFVKASYLVRF